MREEIISDTPHVFQLPSLKTYACDVFPIILYFGFYRWILTAHHCVAKNPNNFAEGLVPVSDAEIFLGLHDLTDPSLTGDFKYERCHQPNV